MTGKNITLMADFSGATATIMTAEGENEARVYRFTVVDVGGAVINLESEGADVALYIMRPGAPVQIGAEINGSTATITIPRGACSVPGKFAAWLQIVTSTYDLRVDGMEFVVKANAIDDGAEQAEAEFGLLTEMIQKGQAAIEKMESYFPTSIENGGTGATTAEAARENLGIQLPLSVEKGGTGATTAEAARENLGITLPLSVENGGTGKTTLAAALSALMYSATPKEITDFASGVSATNIGSSDPKTVRIRKVGNLVFLEGYVKINDVTGNTQTLFNVPSGYAPTKTHVLFAPCSGTNVARINVYATNGAVNLNWIYSFGGSKVTGAVSWVAVDTMWVIGGQPDPGP